jgi:hypothetical protein
MIAHQTKGVDAVTESLDPFLNQKVETCTILIIEENASAAIAAQDDVIECSRIVDSWLSCHAARLHHKLQYSKPDPIIFFITPADSKSNNIKVFAISSSVNKVRRL